MAKELEKKSNKMILITESTNYFKAGQIIDDYKELKEGVEIGKEKHFLSRKKFINLNEALSPSDEKRVREIIRTQLKYMFYQFFTKSNIVLGNLN